MMFPDRLSADGSVNVGGQWQCRKHRLEIDRRSRPSRVVERAEAEHQGATG